MDKKLEHVRNKRAKIHWFTLREVSQFLQGANDFLKLTVTPNDLRTCQISELFSGSGEDDLFVINK